MEVVIKEGDIIQVDKEECYFDQCFMYVDEVKEWGVLAGMYIPEKGWAYMRLKFDEFVVVGWRVK